MRNQHGHKAKRDKTAPANGSAADGPAELLTRKQLSKKINLSTRSIDSLQQRKVIPVIRLSPRCCRFSLQAVLQALGRFEVKEATR